MEQGWIKLHRKILENPIVKKPIYFALWVVLLLKANHKDNKMFWNGNIIVVKEGQLITGRKTLAEETGIPETTIERILNMLENGHQIEQQKTTKFRLITIVNWEEHQKKNSTSDNKRTTNGQQTDTNKNDNNIKNDKNTTTSDLFDEFWSIYPNKKQKKPTMDKFNKLDEDIQKKIIEHIKVRKTKDDQWLRDNGKYIPHPTTFLNQERWEDEYKVSGSQNQIYINKESIADKLKNKLK